MHVIQYYCDLGPKCNGWLVGWMAKRDIITSVAQVTSRKHCRWILLLLEYIVRITFYIPFKLIITWEQLDTTFPRYVIYWGSRSWNLVAWFARDSCVQPPRLVRRPSKHAGANQIATRLLVHCSGPARCCSQPASRPAVIGLLPAVAPTDLRSRQQKSGQLICTHFWKNVFIFVTTTPIDIKTQHMSPAHGRYESVCQISPSYDAALRRR